jgi:hypothetical protein
MMVSKPAVILLPALSPYYHATAAPIEAFQIEPAKPVGADLLARVLVK